MLAARSICARPCTEATVPHVGIVFCELRPVYLCMGYCTAGVVDERIQQLSVARHVCTKKRIIK